MPVDPSLQPIDAQNVLQAVENLAEEVGDDPTYMWAASDVLARVGEAQRAGKAAFKREMDKLRKVATREACASMLEDMHSAQNRLAFMNVYTHSSSKREQYEFLMELSYETVSEARARVADVQGAQIMELVMAIKICHLVFHVFHDNTEQHFWDALQKYHGTCNYWEVGRA